MMQFGESIRKLQWVCIKATIFPPPQWCLDFLDKNLDIPISSQPRTSVFTCVVWFPAEFDLFDESQIFQRNLVLRYLLALRWVHCFSGMCIQRERRRNTHNEVATLNTPVQISIPVNELLLLFLHCHLLAEHLPQTSFSCKMKPFENNPHTRANNQI